MLERVQFRREVMLHYKFTIQIYKTINQDVLINPNLIWAEDWGLELQVMLAWPYPIEDTDRYLKCLSSCCRGHFEHRTDLDLKYLLNSHSSHPLPDVENVGHPAPQMLQLSERPKAINYLSPVDETMLVALCMHFRTCDYLNVNWTLLTGEYLTILPSFIVLYLLYCI